MFRSRTIIAGLEIGTSKVCVMVGEAGEDGVLTIVGVGQAKSRGVRKGEIVDATKTCEDIRTALVEAEGMADVEINRVYLGVTGSHINGINSRGVHPVVSADRQISQDDVEDVVKNAKAMSLPPDKHVIHVIRQHFSVDGQEGILDPVGMCGARIEADVHVVNGLANRMQNAIRVVNSLQIDVEDVVFNGLASALAVLSPDQKELGSLVIDLGGGVTEYAVYSGGIIRHTGVIAVGGDHVTNDLAYGLKVPLSRAESLKLAHAQALVDPRTTGGVIPAKGEVSAKARAVSVDKLNKIASLRIEEIFELIHEDLYDRRLLGFVRSGVWLCGGGARIQRVKELASRVFKVPASVGRTQGISGLTQALDQPEFATAIGLVKCGSFQQRRRETFRQGLRSTLTSIFKKA